MFRKSLVVSVLSLLLSPGLAHADAYGDLRVKATQEYQAGRHQSALDLFKQAYQLNPTPDLANFIQQLEQYVATLPKPAVVATPASAVVTPAPTAAPVRAAAVAQGPKKSGSTTFALSLLPGGGHFYLGQGAKGGFFAASGLGLAVFSLISKGKSDKDYDSYIMTTDPSKLDALYLSYDNAREKANYAMVGATTVWLFSIIDAQNQFKMINMRMETASSGEPKLVARAEF